MFKVLCFGVFDGVHDGHRAMLQEAKTVDSRLSTVVSEKDTLVTSRQSSVARYLIVAIAPDRVVVSLKGEPPRYPAAQRIALVKAERIADEVILGDEDINSWNIVKKVKPSVIALGYDQHELRSSLEDFLDRTYPEVETAEGEWQTNPKRPTIVMLTAHGPHKYHNKIIQRT